VEGLFIQSVGASVAECGIADSSRDSTMGCAAVPTVSVSASHSLSSELVALIET
jgi:hypothetical protein